MKLVTFILGIFFIIDVSALGKIHNAVPIYTDKPFATIGNIDYLYKKNLTKSCSTGKWKCNSLIVSLVHDLSIVLVSECLQ